MKAILKGIIFRSPLNFLYLIIVVGSSIAFAAMGDDVPSFAVWCWVCLYAISVSDARQVKLERSLPVRKETIVDARYLLMFVMLLIETALGAWQSTKSGSWGMQGMMIFSLWFSCGLWIMGSLGIGGNSVSWISLCVFITMLLSVLVGKERFAPAIGMKGSSWLMAAGLISYCAFWCVARRFIRTADY